MKKKKNSKLETHDSVYGNGIEEYIIYNNAAINIELNFGKIIS